MRPGQVPPLPAVRAAIGEEFGLPAGNLVTNEMVSGLRRLGFDRVFDTDFAAVRGMEGVKAASIPVGDVELKVAVGHGLSNVRKIAETGVDFISIGALTHSAPAADLSLVFKIKE